MRQLRSESGQAALFMAIAGVGLLLGSLGVAGAFCPKARSNPPPMLRR